MRIYHIPEFSIVSFAEADILTFSFEKVDENEGDSVDFYDLIINGNKGV